jgi:hypothetical protein
MYTFRITTITILHSTYGLDIHPHTHTHTHTHTKLIQSPFKAHEVRVSSYIQNNKPNTADKFLLREIIDEPAVLTIHSLQQCNNHWNWQARLIRYNPYAVPYSKHKINREAAKWANELHPNYYLHLSSALSCHLTLFPILMHGLKIYS